MPKFILPLIVMLVHMVGFSQSYKLTVYIDSISEIKGTLRLAVFNNAENFKAKIHPSDSAILPINSTKAANTFRLSQNTYAIAVYHDENNDNQLNKRNLGIPTEGIGFSNVYKKTKRPPRFDESSFLLKSDTTILIPLFYNKE